MEGSELIFSPNNWKGRGEERWDSRRSSVRSSTVLNGTQTFSVGCAVKIQSVTERKRRSRNSHRIIDAHVPFVKKFRRRRRWPAVARGCKTITGGRCDALQLVKQLYGKKIAVNAATNFNTSLIQKTEIGPTFLLLFLSFFFF